MMRVRWRIFSVWLLIVPVKRVISSRARVCFSTSRTARSMDSKSASLDSRCAAARVLRARAIDRAAVKKTSERGSFASQVTTTSLP